MYSIFVNYRDNHDGQFGPFSSRESAELALREYMTAAAASIHSAVIEAEEVDDLSCRECNGDGVRLLPTPTRDVPHLHRVVRCFCHAGAAVEFDESEGVTVD